VLIFGIKYSLRNLIYDVSMTCAWAAKLWYA